MRPSVVNRTLRALVQGYRWFVSPMLPPRCRYWPSCSEYALEALRLHGSGRGSWLSLRRLLRCNPWAGGGVDPVPEPRGRARPPAPGHPVAAVRTAGGCAPFPKQYRDTTTDVVRP